MGLDCSPRFLLSFFGLRYVYLYLFFRALDENHWEFEDLHRILEVVIGSVPGGFCEFHPVRAVSVPIADEVERLLTGPVYEEPGFTRYRSQ